MRAQEAGDSFASSGFDARRASTGRSYISYAHHLAIMTTHAPRSLRLTLYADEMLPLIYWRRLFRIISILFSFIARTLLRLGGKAD